MDKKEAGCEIFCTYWLVVASNRFPYPSIALIVALAIGICFPLIYPVCAFQLFMRKTKCGLKIGSPIYLKLYFDCYHTALILHISFIVNLPSTNHPFMLRRGFQSKEMQEEPVRAIERICWKDRGRAKTSPSKSSSCGGPPATFGKIFKKLLAIIGITVNLTDWLISTLVLGHGLACFLSNTNIKLNSI